MRDICYTNSISWRFTVCTAACETQIMTVICSIVLGHLSKENNMPELAYEAVRMEVNMSDSQYYADDFHIMVAKRDEPSVTINF